MQQTHALHLYGIIYHLRVVDDIIIDESAALILIMIVQGPFTRTAYNSLSMSLCQKFFDHSSVGFLAIYELKLNFIRIVIDF